MANTFTGLKLQGNIGKFGKIDISDVVGFDELASNGNIISGTEHGQLLMWEAQFVYVNASFFTSRRSKSFASNTIRDPLKALRNWASGWRARA